VDLGVYKNIDYGRGYLVSSSNKRETELQNSKAFLLSNMSPQTPAFNWDSWKELEIAIRRLDSQKKNSGNHVISGPIFDYRAKVKQIGTRGKDHVLLPVPDAYFKSVLTKNNRAHYTAVFHEK
jgi:endonuclease G